MNLTLRHLFLKKIQCFFNIIKSVQDDERCRTIEVSTEEECKIDDTIIGIIAPNDLLLNQKIYNKVYYEWNLKKNSIKTYCRLKTMSTRDYTNFMILSIINFMKMVEDFKIWKNSF